MLLATPNWQTPMPSHPGADDVMFMGLRETDNYFMYENVDPSKVRREEYMECSEFLLHPYPVYLDCHMMGYLVPKIFWRELVPHLYMAGYHSLEQPNTVRWLSVDQMNAWIELLIRERRHGDRWTVSKSGTIYVYNRRPEINRLMTLPDHPLIEYGRYALGCMTRADMRNASYLKMARDGLLRSMEEK
ncbi:hypothetical protein Tco_0661895 [Tanacetum coccineum]